MDGLKKEREWRKIQQDLFSGSLSGLEELPVDFSEKLFHRLVDYATVHSDGRVVLPFAMAWKSAQRYKVGRQVLRVLDICPLFLRMMEIKCIVYGNL